MSAKIRIFTPAELEAIGVPFECASPTGPMPGHAIALADEIVDARWWASIHRLIFRAPDDGKAYDVRYERPGAMHDQGPWGRRATVQATEVEGREFTVTRWLPVEGE